MPAHRTLAALAALLLAACGGIADDSSAEYSGDDLALVAEEPAPSPEPVAAPSVPAPSDEAEPAVEPEPTPAPEVEPSSPMEGDDFVIILPEADDTFELPASPCTRDDAPSAPAAEPDPAPVAAEEPAPVAGTTEGGELCTADAECVPGLACAEVFGIVQGGVVLLDERRCGFVTP